MYIPQHQFDVLPETIRHIVALSIAVYVAYRIYAAWTERRCQETARAILEFLAAGESSIGDLIADLSLCIEPESAERCIERMAAEGLVLVPIDPVWGVPSNALCRISPEGMRAMKQT